MAQRVKYVGRNAKFFGKVVEVLATKPNPRDRSVRDVRVKLSDGLARWVSGRSVTAPGAKVAPRAQKAKAAKKPKPRPPKKAKAAPEPGEKAGKSAA